VAGWLLDVQGHGVGLWLLMALVCLLSLPLLGRIERNQRTSRLRLLPIDGTGPRPRPSAPEQEL
jgi:hypothetical protein